MAEIKHGREVRATVLITIHDDVAPADLITRGMDPEFASAYYGEMDEKAVLDHWAYNAVMNGVSSPHRLDGWADIPKDAVDLWVTDAEVDS